MITTRKIKLIAEDKEFYTYFKQEQREQNKALNIGIGIIHANSVLKNIDSGAEKKLQKSIAGLNKKIDKLKNDLNKDKITDKKKSEIEKAINTNKSILDGEIKAYKESEDYRKGLDELFSNTYLKSNTLDHVLDSAVNIQYKYTLSLVTQRLKQDYNNDFVSIMTGQQSVRNYKNDNPLMFATSYLKLNEDEKGFYFDVMRGYRLRVVIGRRCNENLDELKSVLKKIINKEYKLCNSSMQMDNKDLILNMCVDIPKEISYKHIEGRVLGVDLGLNVPAYISLNDDTYKKEAIGNINQFLKVREQMQERRKKLQQSLTTVKGGKGRDRKLQALNKLRENESNYCKTFNHAASKRIVQFAKKYKCQYINMEKLSKDGFPDIILRNWSFYQLREMVEYKAKREGIELRLVDPAYTSQQCSRCGNIDSDNRPKKQKGQAYFKCTKCGFELNADHNAAINIARSEKFM